jgi:hypothetical protein
MFDSSLVYDGRVRYPGRIMASVPPGVREAAQVAADAQGVSVAAFARKAIIQALVDDSGQKPETDGASPRQTNGAA